jgi:type III secretory pathway component EscV
LLTWEVFHNSDLVLSPSLCEAIRERWASEEESASAKVARISAEDFRELLLLMADRGNRIDRILDIDRCRDELGLPWARRCFESAIVTDGATSINLTVNSGVPDAISQSAHQCTTELLHQMGVMLPKPSVVDDRTLEQTVFQIRFNDLRLPPMKALTLDELQSHLAFMLQRNVARFLSTESVQCSLDLLREEFPATVECTRQRIAVPNLTATLRELLEESISIRDLRGILESLLQNQVWGPPQPGVTDDFDAVWHAGSVRADLKRYITYKLSHANTMFVHLLELETESRLEDADSDPLTVEERHSLLSRIIHAIDGQVHTGRNAVLLTKFEIQKTLRRLLATEFPSLAVLSFNDLSPDVNIQPLGKI